MNIEHIMMKRRGSNREPRRLSFEPHTLPILLQYTLLKLLQVRIQVQHWESIRKIVICSGYQMIFLKNIIFYLHFICNICIISSSSTI